MNPESNQGGSGISPIQMPKERARLFFFLFVRPPPWRSVLEGFRPCCLFPPEATFCNERSLSPSRPLKRFEASRTHTPLPHRRRVFTSFLGCTFSYRPRFPPQTNEREHTEYIKTRLALPLFFDTNTRPHDHGKSPQTPNPLPHFVSHERIPPPLVSARTHSIHISRSIFFIHREVRRVPSCI